MSSSSSTTRTRAGRLSMTRNVRPDPQRFPRIHACFTMQGRPPGRRRVGSHGFPYRDPPVLAAGTLGIGPGGVRPDHVDTAFGRTHGGVVGELLYSAITTGLGSVGAHIVALFTFVAGVLLLTGASIAGVVKATSDSVTSGTRRVRTGATEVTQAVRRRRVTEELEALEAWPARVTAVARRMPAPEHELPDVLGDAEEVDLDDEIRVEQTLAEDEDQPGVEKLQPAQLDLTPQGRLRSSVTDDPAFAWRMPDPAFLKRSSEQANRPDTVGQEKTGNALVEALGHFGVEARIVGTVAGPHITRYELRLAPGTKVATVAQLKDDLAYA